MSIKGENKFLEKWNTKFLSLKGERRTFERIVSRFASWLNTFGEDQQQQQHTREG